MCNLYAQRKPRGDLRGLFATSGNRIGEIKDQPSTFPCGLAPVIRKADDGDLVAEMIWGFVEAMELAKPFSAEMIVQVGTSKEDELLVAA